MALFADWQAVAFQNPDEVAAFYLDDAKLVAAEIGAILDTVPVLDCRAHYLKGLNGDKGRHYYRGSVRVDKDGTAWPSITFGTYKGGGQTAYWCPRDLAWRDFERERGDFQGIDDSQRQQRTEQLAAIVAKAATDKALADAEADRLAEEAKAKAQATWASAYALNGSSVRPPYANRKGITPYGAKGLQSKIIVPVYISGVLSNLQTIENNGDKFFIPDGRVKGGFTLIGDITSAKTVLLCEGWATGCSIHEATNLPVIVCFSAGNLLPVATEFRAECPDYDMVFCADNDESGTGQNAAMTSADATGGRCVVPVFASGYGDFNDLHKAQGLSAVKTQVLGAEQPQQAIHLDVSGIDLLSPPGFAGELTDWINDQCLFPRKSLAVATALTAIGNIVGMSHDDEFNGVTTNLVTFCVAGSGTGKETLMQCMSQIMLAAGMGQAVHGSFKSEKELVTNLCANQSAFYVIDELGEQLSKLVNSKKKGGASYLEGVIGQVMSVYSKARGLYPITGDLKREMRKHAEQAVSQIKGWLKNPEDGQSLSDLKTALADAEDSLDAMKDGMISDPFLSIIGYTTPKLFGELFDENLATNGMLGRALVFNEPDTNPDRKCNRFKKRPMPDVMRSRIATLMAPDQISTSKRVEFKGQRYIITTDADAAELLDQSYEYFYRESNIHVENTGLESISRRAYELVCKVSLILAAPTRRRTVEHVKYAHALIIQDINTKAHMAFSNMTDRAEGIEDKIVQSKVLSKLDFTVWKRRGAIQSACHSKTIKKEDIDTALEWLVANGYVKKEQHPDSRGILRDEYIKTSKV